MTPKQKASIQLSYIVTQMREHCRKNKIRYDEIQDKTGIKNISRFMNNKVPTPNVITFILIAEAIGFEVNVTMKSQS